MLTDSVPMFVQTIPVPFSYFCLNLLSVKFNDFFIMFKI